jgi:hypothetical protein
MWTRPFRTASWIFLLNRYTSFAGYIVIAIYDLIPFSTVACIRFDWFRQILAIFSAIAVSGELADGIQVERPLNDCNCHLRSHLRPLRLLKKSLMGLFCVRHHAGSH